MATRDDLPPVLICGAGPTGLVLALWLARRQVPFRIIDKAPHSGTASRALVVQARTLELYRMLGIDRSITSQARDVDQLRLWVRQRLVGTVFFGRESAGISAFPNFYVFPQDEHEAALEKELNNLAVTVERETELLGFEEREDRILAQIKGSGGITTTPFSYLAGCDGARS